MDVQPHVVVICTDRGRHKRRVLDRVAVVPSPHDDRPLLVTVVPEGVEAGESVRRQEDVTFRGRRGYVRKWVCPSCGRDVRRQDADLIEPLTQLMNAGVSELDISA